MTGLGLISIFSQASPTSLMHRPVFNELPITTTNLNCLSLTQPPKSPPQPQSKNITCGLSPSPHSSHFSQTFPISYSLQCIFLQRIRLATPWIAWYSYSLFEGWMWKLSMFWVTRTGFLWSFESWRRIEWIRWWVLLGVEVRTSCWRDSIHCQISQGRFQKNYLLMNAYGSISTPSTTNFFSYSPLSPRKVGMPLPTDTPAPVTKSISSFFIIASTAFSILIGTGLGRSSSGPDLRMGWAKDLLRFFASFSRTLLQSSFILSQRAVVSWMSEIVSLTPVRVPSMRASTWAERYWDSLMLCMNFLCSSEFITIILSYRSNQYQYPKFRQYLSITPIIITTHYNNITQQMGNTCSNCKRNRYKTVPIEHSLFALLMANNTEECLNLMQANPNINYSEPVNRNGDNLLHYAAKKNNYQIVKYILGVDPRAATCLNQGKKIPINLATEERVVGLFRGI